MRLPQCALCFCAVLLVTGCGAKSASVQPFTPTPVAISITVQPLSQRIPPGGTATFAVSATSTAPLSYQWSDNGTEIAGATGASYTTPEIPLGTSVPSLIGTYQVTVSNSSSSVTSNTAALTAGPRSPKPGDLRYMIEEQVGLPGLYDAGFTTDVSAGTVSTPNSVGSALSMGNITCGDPAAGVSSVCGWQIFMFALPPPMTGINMFYKAGNYTDFTSDMQPILTSDVVLISLDLEPANDAYGVATVQTTQPGGFDYRLEPIPMGTDLQTEIQGQADQDGAASRIITAVSFDDKLGQADLISYGWTGDTSTVYDTKTMIIASEGDVAAAAITLAGEGYVISAFGGNETDGYLLVGTRVKGDSLPRQICVFQHWATLSSTPCLDNGFYDTMVVKLYDNDDSTDITEQ